jgi:ubiquinone/menaquinone biosynthesis C-methylase UbiE
MSWQYDEMRQVGVDFENAAQVAAYDSKQGSDRSAERDLIRRLGIAPGHVVVDLGCGTGSFAREAARAGARVRAVDVSERMLEFLRRESEREGISGVDCEHAGFLTCAAEPGSIDCVVSRFALHHLPDFWKQVALLRLSRALKPGGVLYLRDVVFSFEPRAYEASVDEWLRRMPEVSGFSRGEFETHVREEYSTFSWVLEGMIARADLEIRERAYPAPEYAEYLCRPRAVAV